VLIAECHVFHRLLPPRHPPDALLTLDLMKSMCSGKRRALHVTQISVRHIVGFLQTDPLHAGVTADTLSAEANTHGTSCEVHQARCRINLSLTMTNIPKLKSSGNG
jgi:hypothetical protein